MGTPTLTERLAVLFSAVPVPEGGRLYSDERAADEITAAGTDVTAAQLHQLRSGEITQSDPRLLNGIADLFDVPHTYFTDDHLAQQIGDQLRLLARVRDSGVRRIVDGENLPPGALTAILDKIEQQPRP